MKRVHSRIARPTGSASGTGSRAAGALRLATSFVLSLGALGVARTRGCPGVAMHARAVRLLARAALRGRRGDLARRLAEMSAPMDSVRYFELDFAWRHSAAVPRAARYLDASSPRLFPLCLLDARPDLRAELANPDGADLDATIELASAAGVGGRCAFHRRRIDELDLPPRAFDLVTSVSVLEHIPGGGDAVALARLWSLVRRGGRLVVTVPVAREAFDEYLDVDEYGLSPPSQDGWSFGQHFYDASGLAERFLSVAGEPAAMEIFGEVRPGLFVADRAEKTSGRARRWREPLAFASAFRPFASIEALPGWGVAALAFAKAE